MTQTVRISGPFTFMTERQLDAIRIAFAADAPVYDRELAGGQVNGESFQFTHAGVSYQRTEFASLLHAAYWDLGVTQHGWPAPNRSAASFT